MRRPTALAALLAAAVLAAVVPAAHAQSPGRTVDVQVLAFNDFHGNLEPEGLTVDVEPPAGKDEAEVNAGGAAYLAAHLRQWRRGQRYSITVANGDNIGASPLLSALFHDEPTIEALDRMKVSLSTVGNHEFDEGLTELRRMQDGGCSPIDGCQDGNGFSGARFDYLAANVVERSTGRTIFPAYKIRKFGGVPVAFIGVVLRGTPNIVSPSGVAGLEFLDEAAAVKPIVARLRKRGINAFVLLAHQGSVQTKAESYEINGCKDVEGDLDPILAKLPRAVKVVLSGHTHQAYNCAELDGRRVTQALSYGRVVTDLHMRLSRSSGRIVSTTARNRIVTRRIRAAADVKRILTRYDKLAAPLRDRVIGKLAAAAPTTTDATGQSVAGNLIADAQLAATSGASTGAAVAAFMNPGGVRGTAGLPAGDVSYGDSFTLEPFGNSLVTLSLTGTQVLDLLKQQWCGQTEPRILLPSAGVKYTWSQAAATAITGKPCDGAATPVSGLTIGGATVSAAGTYRVTVNSFLADGGDSFSVLPAGTDRLGGAVDVDAVEAYLAPTLTGAPLAPPALDRITAAP